MAKTRKLRALKPHQYGNRRLGRDSVYTPESSLHARVLVQAGFAAWHKETPKREPLEPGKIEEKGEQGEQPQAQVSPEPVDKEDDKAPKKKRARKKARKQKDSAKHGENE